MSASSLKRPEDRRGFKIGIICALSLEADMVQKILDKDWTAEGTRYGMAEGDMNSYTTGAIGEKNVVLAYCSTMGSNNAAQVAMGLKSSFTQIKIVFLVGICGVAPRDTDGKEIILGDCLVSTAVVQFDLGRQGPTGFKAKDGLDALGRAGIQVGSLMTKLKTGTSRERLHNNLKAHLSKLHTSLSTTMIVPGNQEDRLFTSAYTHAHRPKRKRCQDCDSDTGLCGKSCAELGCQDEQLVPRKRLQSSTEPAIHFGIFGSSNSVMKSGLHRDKLVKDKKIIAFEMEGSGIWDVYPTVIIKAACDYADSHKDKRWQPYAAAVAAAGLKAFLAELEFPDEPLQPKDQNNGLGLNANSIVAGHSSQTAYNATKPYFKIPHLRNRRFTGRTTQLDELEQRLFKNKDSRSLAVFGLGGVGKTQLALAFCYMVKERYPSYSIFWASALSFTRFRKDYAEIAHVLGLEVGSNEDDQVTAYVQKHLSSEATGEWLLVIDNADDEELLFNNKSGLLHALPQSELGKILYTTRYKDIAYDLADSNILVLEGMEAHEAEDFLSRSLNSKDVGDDPRLVRDLLQELAYLPLAITQASSYITKTSMSISKYLALIKNTENEMIKLLSQEFRHNTHDPNDRNAIAVTWFVSFERLRRETPDAADILFFIASLENKAIPLSILPSAPSAVDMTTNIGALIGYSFLTTYGDEAVYDIHRLVHLAIKLWMEKEGLLEPWKRKTLGHLADVFPSYEWQNRNKWQAYIPHVIRILLDTEQISSEERATLSFRVGSCLRVDGRTMEAAKWISKCTSWASAALPEDHPMRLRYQHELAVAYLWNQQVKLAVEMLEKVVAIEERVLAEDHPDRLASQHELASAFRLNGQVKLAVEMLEKVVIIKEREQVEDHPDRLASQHELAKAYLSNGQVKEAVEILEKVVAIEERVLVEDHPDRLASQHELSRAYRSNKQVKEAVEMLEKVVAIRKRVLAEDHPDRLASQHYLAFLYESEGRLDEAVALIQHVVAVRRISSRADHPDRLSSENLLLRLLGRERNNVC